MTLHASQAAWILGSPSPLTLGSLRCLMQRWFSPQALTLGAPHPSWISPKFVGIEVFLTSNTALSSSCKDFTYPQAKKLEQLDRTPDL